MSFSICVYCGSQPGLKPEFSQAASSVGRWIGEQGGQLVYGGGSGGLMGIVAQATLESGGRVVGVIPKALVKKELAKRDCTELHTVDSMHDRKRMMAERSDAFLALSGGIGTLEEFFEVWTWRQLGYHDKPIGLLNTQGFYDHLLKFLNATQEQGFLREKQMGLIQIETQPIRLLQTLVRASRGSVAGHFESI